MKFAGHTTDPIAYNEEAGALKAKLELLPPLEEVTVERFGPNFARGYEWHVTFNKVNKDTVYGYIPNS